MRDGMTGLQGAERRGAGAPVAVSVGESGVRVCVLGSGSSGNCTWVECGDDAILVDAGLSAQRTRRTLKECGLDETKLRAICVTPGRTPAPRSQPR